MMLTPQRQKRPGRQPIQLPASIPAPVRGWNAKDPEAAMAPGYALYLENFWPTPTEVEVRPGALDWSTDYDDPVLSLMAYKSASGTAKLFAGTDGGIFDATSSGAVGGVASAITNGKCSHVLYTTTGGSFLAVVNGTDDYRYYNGTTWTTVATFVLGGGTINTNTLDIVHSHKRRLFFIAKNSMDFYYLPVDTITGTVLRFHIGALFKKGGNLVAMATWTIDGGDGADDYAVFATSEGQLAVYQGLDPATDWALVGVYDLGPPLGKKCFRKYGGDLLYLSTNGVFPLSQALKPQSSQQAAAINRLVAKPFLEAVRLYSVNYGWQITDLPSASLLLINIPVSGGATQFLMNTESGAWCNTAGWDAICWEVLNDQLYMGMATKVAKAWVGTQDFGSSITAVGKTAFSYLNAPGNKQVKLIRPMVKTAGQASINIEVDTDFKDANTYSAPVFGTASGSLWGTGVWGTAVYGGSPKPKLDWLTAACPPAYCAAIRLRVISSGATVSWTATDLLYEQGALK